MSKVIPKLLYVLAGLLVYLQRNVIFKKTIVAWENDWVYTLQDVIRRVSRLRVVLVCILLIHDGAAVVEDGEVALADRKVAGDLSYWSCVEVPDESGTQLTVLLEIAEVLLEDWLCLVDFLGAVGFVGKIHTVCPIALNALHDVDVARRIMAHDPELIQRNDGFYLSLIYPLLGPHQHLDKLENLKGLTLFNHGPHLEIFEVYRLKVRQIVENLS